MSPVTADLCASEPFPPKFPSSIYFFALSQAPPPAVIETATNKPVIITPNNIAPREDNAASIPPTCKIIKYKIIGNPHSKSFDDENTWIYIERTLSKGKYHKLGRHVLKTNNALVLEFNKYGILKNKKIYSKEDIQKVTFSTKNTENKLTKKSFVETFLSSVREKMYGNK